MRRNKFKITFTMNSDWRIGTGSGIPGGIDDLISRDVDGFPRIPAKSIVGIWRDAMERLCRGLGDPWRKWVDHIFGTQPNVRKEELDPGSALDTNGAGPNHPNAAKDDFDRPSSAIISITPARLPENIRANISDDRFKAAMTFVKVGVKIDSEFGTSKDEALRFEEMGRIGTVLEADVELERSNEIVDALLILSSRMIERIGGNRRRGAGKCKVGIEGVDQAAIDNAIKIIDGNRSANFKTPPTGPESTKHKISKTDDSVWRTIDYTLKLETPVSVVSAVLGNVSETLDFIPGTYLIPFFIRRFEGIFEAIQRGDFQISPATISVGGVAGQPVPKVFAAEKMNKANGYNRSRVKSGEAQTKPLREGYLGSLSANSDISIVKTPLTVAMHNAVDDDSQRPTTDVVGIYSREAIKAGTIMKGQIRFRGFNIDPADLNGKVAPEKVRLGTSRKDDYGLASITFGKVAEFTGQSLSSKNNQISVFFASDTLLPRTPDGDMIGSLTYELSDLLNSNLAVAPKVADLITTLVQTRRVESWQTVWGLPRPTLTAIAAGSVITFDCETLPTDDQLREIEAVGIGDRRGEGYGRIIFNPPILTLSDLKITTGKADAVSTASKGNMPSTPFTSLLEEIVWLREIDFAASRVAAGLDIPKNKRPPITLDSAPMSQLGALRSVVTRVSDANDAAKVLTWFDKLKATPNRLEKWKGVDLATLRSVFTGDVIWDYLGTRFKPPNLIAGSDVKDRLWADAVKHFYYAVQHEKKRSDERKEAKDVKKD